MIKYRAFMDTVSSVISILDIAEQLDMAVLVNAISNSTRIDYDQAEEVLRRMEAAGLLVIDATYDGNYKSQVVAITGKGRDLAADIRGTLGNVIS